MTRRIERPVFAIEDANRFKLDAPFVDAFAGQEPRWGPVGKVTFLRTYAQELPGGRVEEYWEACRRVVEGIWSVFKQVVRAALNPWDDDEAQAKAQEMYRRLWAFKWLPPGRGLQFMGTRAVELKGGGVLNNCGFVSTGRINQHFAEPFCVLMDFLMLGVGMGYDVRGTGRVVVQTPVLDPQAFLVEDTREGWVAALRRVLGAFVGEATLPTRFDYSAIRPEGARLKTLGGTASGHAPLERLLTEAQRVLGARAGQPITTTDISDLMNFIGACVVAGNIRRSAEIGLGLPDDAEFLLLKDPSELRRLSGLQAERAAAMPAVRDLDAAIAEVQGWQTGHDVMSDDYQQAQDSLDGYVRRRKALLVADTDWTALQAQVDAHPLYTHRWAANLTVMCAPGQDVTALAAQTARNGEPGYLFLHNAKAYGRMCDAGPTLPPETEWQDRYVEGCNPCGEQGLENNELCCLVEVNPNAHETLDDFLITLKYAYMYAKGVTLIPTHRPATNAVITRNRRIGTSLMGVFKMYERLGMSACIRWWDAGYHEVARWDRTYSHWLGVPQSVKRMTVKPGGSVPLLPGEEGGMKLTCSEYYYRTIRIEQSSAIVTACRAAGYRVEQDRYSARTVVVYFPVHVPGIRYSAQVSLWEQAALLVALQAYWSDNMVSNTLTFQPHEAADIPRVLGAYASRLKGIAFLPLTNHGYAQAPYIPITAEEHACAVARLTPTTFRDVRHEVDEKYCTGELCELPG